MAFDLEHGLMLFDKWKANPDLSQPVDDWIWDNIGEVFNHLEALQTMRDDIKMLRRFTEQCRHYDQGVHQCVECNAVLSNYCDKCQHDLQT